MRLREFYSLQSSKQGVHGHFSPGPAVGGFGSAGAGALSIPACFPLLPWGSPLSATACL